MVHLFSQYCIFFYCSFVVLGFGTLHLRFSSHSPANNSSSNIDIFYTNRVTERVATTKYNKKIINMIDENNIDNFECVDKKSRMLKSLENSSREISSRSILSYDWPFTCFSCDIVPFFKQISGKLVCIVLY